MPTHASLTGANLHEPKGADSASVDTVYVSDGAGSGSWSKIDSSNLDATSIKNTNLDQLGTLFIDIGTVSTQYIVIPFACTVTAVYSVVQTSPTSSNTVITFNNNGGSSMGTITITAADPAGTVDSLVPVTNNTFTAGQILQMVTDGGAANNPNAYIVFHLTRT